MFLLEGYHLKFISKAQWEEESKVIDAGICSTPVLMFANKYLDCDGTAIISASHNPPQYNGMKCLAPSGTFLSREELTEINQYFHEHESKGYVPWKEFKELIVRTDFIT